MSTLTFVWCDFMFYCMLHGYKAVSMENNKEEKTVDIYFHNNTIFPWGEFQF